VSHGGGRKPGGDSPRVVCTTGEGAGRGRRSLQREKRRRARSVFFSSPLFSSSSPRRELFAIFRGDLSLGAISHLRRVPANTAVWAASRNDPRRDQDTNRPFVHFVLLLSFFLSSHCSLLRKVSTSRGRFAVTRFLIIPRFLWCDSRDPARKSRAWNTVRGSCANTQQWNSFSLFFSHMLHMPHRQIRQRRVYGARE